MGCSFKIFFKKFHFRVKIPRFLHNRPGKTLQKLLIAKKYAAAEYGRKLRLFPKAETHTELRSYVLREMLNFHYTARKIYAAAIHRCANLRR